MSAGASAFVAAPVGLLGDGARAVADDIVEMVWRLDVEVLLQLVNAWAEGCGEVKVITLDAKCLRGRKRGELPVVQVLVVTAQQVGVVLQQRGVEGDVLEAVPALLEELPLEGKVVSLDPGSLQRRLVGQVVQKGGG